MTVPSYDNFLDPLLRHLAASPEGVTSRDAYEAVANALGLSPEQRAELLPSGQQATYKNRTGWAQDRLKRAGLSTSPRHGFWQLTDKGLLLARSTPAGLSETQLHDILVMEYSDDTSATHASHSDAGTLSPDDRLVAALSEINAAVARELQELIHQSSPEFFERLVLALLNAMGYGYGSSREALQHTGGSGDGGIDGIINLDRLGLEKVYVQAKRWKDPPGRPDVQKFYGALAAHRATKGVFITTSSIADPAIEYAKSVGSIVLVDGKQLTALMIEHGVGVSYSRTVKVPRTDSDFFEE